MNAQAIVFRKANEPSLETVDLPTLGPDEICVRTLYSGVSIGTESSIFSGVRTQNGTFPLVGGYMTTAVVESVGTEVSTFAEGDRVTNMGSRLEGPVTAVWGGHMSRRIVPVQDTLPLPAKTCPREGALFVLPAVGLNALAMCGVTEQDTVLIIGQGLIGQFFGQFVKRRGARVIAVEPDQRRADLSRRHVTPHVLQPDHNIEERVRALTDGRGPTVVVEATASAKNIRSATRHLTRGARMLFLSWYPGEIALEFSHFHNYAVSAFFPTGPGNLRTRAAVLEALGDGTIIVGDNLTDVLPCDQACDGYRRIIAGDRGIMGMVIDWSDA